MSFLRARARPTRTRDIEAQTSLVLLKGIGDQAAAYGRSGRRAIGQVETAVVLWTLDECAFHEPRGEMCIAVSAKPVGCVKVAVGIPIECVGLPAMVQTNDVFAIEVGGGADLDPTLGVRPNLADEHL